jgi:DNA repair exonuclease SbcCD ATPase subunit
VPNETKPLTLLSLKVENIKRIACCEIHPDGSPVIVLRGENGCGKSSLIDGLIYSLSGKDAQCEQPIRDGADEARVLATFEDLIVRLRLTRKGGRELVVTNAAGARYSQPQAMLDALIKRVAFDPGEFLRLKPARQTETLRDLAGLDFTALEADKQVAYSLRRDLDRDARGLLSRLDALPYTEDIEPVDLDAALDEQARLTEAQSVRAHLAQSQVLKQDKIRDLTQRIAELESRLANSRADLAEYQEDLAIDQGRLEVLPDSAAGLAALRRRISDAEAINHRARQQAERRGLAEQLADLQAQSAEQSEAIAAVDAAKADRLAAAVWPVDGLGLDDHGVTWQGLPLDQASSGEKLHVSVAIGFALNPGIRLVCIRDASLLDPESLRLVAQLARDHDGQVILEIVGEGDLKVVFSLDEPAEAEPPARQLEREPALFGDED